MEYETVFYDMSVIKKHQNIFLEINSRCLKPGVCNFDQESIEHFLVK